MSEAGFRPTFSRIVECDAEEAAGLVSRLVEGETARYDGQRVGRHVTMAPVASDHRWYSAHLTLEFEDPEDDQRDARGGCVLRARFHPKPSVWTFVMVIELGCLTGAMIGGMWGASELLLGRTAWGLVVACVLVIIAVALLVGARVAQRIDRPNMLRMRDSVDEALGTSAQATGP